MLKVIVLFDVPDNSVDPSILEYNTTRTLPAIVDLAQKDTVTTFNMMS